MSNNVNSKGALGVRQKMADGGATSYYDVDEQEHGILGCPYTTDGVAILSGCSGEFIKPRKTCVVRYSVPTTCEQQNYYVCLQEDVEDEPLPYLSWDLLNKVLEYIPEEGYMSTPSDYVRKPDHMVSRYNNCTTISRIGRKGRHRRTRVLYDETNLPLEFQYDAENVFSQIESYWAHISYDNVWVEVFDRLNWSRTFWDLDLLDCTDLDLTFQCGRKRFHRRIRRKKKPTRPWQKRKPPPIESYNELVARDYVESGQLPKGWNPKGKDKEDFDELVRIFSDMEFQNGIDPVAKVDQVGDVSLRNDPPGERSDGSVKEEPPDKKYSAWERKFIRISTKLREAVNQKGLLSPLLSTLENVLLAAYNTWRAYTRSDNWLTIDLLSIFTTFMKSEFPHGSSIMATINLCTNYILGLKPEEPEMAMQSGIGIGAQANHWFKSFKYHPAARHTMALVSLCITLGFVQPARFSMKGFTLFETQAWKKSEHCSDIFEAILTSTGYLFDRAHECFKEGSISPLTKHTGEVGEFRLGVAHIRATMEEIKQGNYEEFYEKTEEEWATKLDDLIKLSRTITPSLSYTRKEIEADKLHLDRARCEFEAHKRGSGIREAPFGMAFHGRSGVGKSTAQSYILKALMAYNGMSHKNEYIGYVNPSESFQSGLRSNTLAIIMDDYANGVVGVTPTSEGVWAIQFINNAKSTANVAIAEDKGKIDIKPKFVSITTNVKTLNAEKLSNCPESILRRFGYFIGIEVKPEYRIHGSHALDEAKVMEAYPNVGVVEDIWEVTIEKPNFASNYSALPSFSKVIDDNGVELTKVGLFTALRFLYSKSKRHFDIQKLLVAKARYFDDNMPICATCKALIGACDCCAIKQSEDLEFQSGVLHSEEQQVTTMFKPNFRLQHLARGTFWYDALSTMSVWAGCAVNGVNPLPFMFKEVAGLIYYGTKNTVRDVLTTTSLVLCPTLLDKYALVTMDYWSDVLSFRLFRRYSLQRFYSVLPDSFVMTDTFETLYTFLERKNMLSVFKYSMLPVTGLYTLGIGSILSSRCTRQTKVYGSVGMSAGYLAASAGAFYYCKKKFEGQLYDLRTTRNERYAAMLANETKHDDEIEEMQSGAVEAYERHKLATFRIGCAVAIILGAGALGKIFSCMKDLFTIDVGEPQSSTLHSEDGSHVEARDKKRDIYVVKKTMAVGKNASYDVNTFMSMIAHNQRYMRIIGAGHKDLKKYSFCNTVVLKDNILLAPRHMFYEDKDTLDKMYDFPIRLETVQHKRFAADGTLITGTTNKSIKLEAGSIVPVGDTDLVLLYVSTGPVTNIMKHLSEDHYSGVIDTLRRDENGELLKTTGTCSARSIPYVITRGTHTWTYNAINTVNKYDWNDGDCMTTIIGSGPPRIVGFHLMGSRGTFGNSQKNGVAIIPPIDEINKAIVTLGNNMGLSFQGATYVPEEILGQSINLNYSMKISPFNFISHHVENPVFEFYGNCDGGVTPRSNIRKSIVNDTLCRELGIEDKWGPPLFAPDGKKFIPWETGLKAMCDPCVVANLPVLSWSKRDYMRPLLPALSNYCKLKSTIFRPLTEREVVNGVDGLRFIDHMNFNTSMGFPIRKKKRDHMETLFDDDGIEYKDFVDRKYWNAANDWEAAVIHGLDCPHHVFSTFLKDETLPRVGSDGKPKKVRLVQSAPIVLQLLVRKYYLPVLRFICTHPLISECAVGINAVGPEWQEVYEAIMEKTGNPPNPEVIAGDFSCWDQRMPGNLTMVSMSILMDLARYTGNYSQQDLVVMEALARELSYPLVNFNGSLVRFLGLMCSGNNLTAVLNSVNNALLQRYIFRLLSIDQKVELEFREVAKLLTYGDDFITGPRSDILTWYNHCTIATRLKLETSMVMTMADKKATPVPTTPLYETDFLKRLFAPVEGLVYEGKQYHVGKLAIDSIHKSLMYTDALKCNERMVISQTMCSAIHELFYHGREVYERYREIFLKVADAHGVPATFLTRTYDERVLMWLDYHFSEKPTYTYEAFLGYEDEHVPDDLAFDFMCGTIPNGGSCLVTHYSTNNDASRACFMFGFYKFMCLWYLAHMSSGAGSCHMMNTRPTKINEDENLTEAGSSQRGVHGVRMEFQSGNALEQSTTTTSLATILDTPGGELHQDMITDATYDMIVEEDVSLSQFLSRPVLIADGTLVPNFTQDIQVLRAFCNNKRVCNRINNYAYIKGTMCVKIMINGSATDYGKYIAAVDYYPDYDTTMVLFGGPTLTQLTQMPHICLNPTQASAGCLEIPLYSPYNAIPLANAKLAEVVTLRFREMNALKSLDPLTTSNISYTVWAWFKEVTLMGPTQINSDFLIAQSGDEYSRFSAKASLVANAIGAFKKAPIVGPYARASEMAVGGMAQLMSLFGYSRPAIEPQHNYIYNHPPGVLSNYNAKDTSLKLALDVKNEVTVDPRVVGLEEDEMSLVHISNKSSRVYDYIWSTGMVGGIMVWNVTPTLGKNAGMITLIPPMAHAALPFKYWRGTIAYTIEVVASAFHKGKLRIAHDPTCNIAMVGSDWYADTNLNNAYVMDISVEREYTFYVGWATNQSFLHTTLPYEQFTVTTALPADPTNIYYNGRVGISVLTALSSSVGTATPEVYINVYARACPDFEVAVPFCDHIDNFSYNEPKDAVEDDYNFQSGVVEETPGGVDDGAENGMQVMLTDTTNTPRNVTDDLLSIHMGERITSARQLVKRYCPNTMIYLYTLCNASFGSNGGLNFAWMDTPDFPCYAGWATAGTAWWFTEPGGKYKVYVSPCNWLTWFTPAYVMRRGSLRNKYIHDDNSIAAQNSQFNVVINWGVSIAAHLQNGFSKYCKGISAGTITSDNGNYTANFGDPGPMCGFCGLATNDWSAANTLSVECPFQTPARFRMAQNRSVHAPAPTGTKWETGAHRVWVTIYNWSNAGGMWHYIRRYTAAGDDFSLHMYKHAPPLINGVFSAPI